MKLRYYADNYDETEHEKTVSLLKTIQQETNLVVEIEQINSRHGFLYSAFETVRESNKSDVYDRDFHRNQTLSDNLDSTPSDTYKNSKGTTAFITGLLGVVSEDELLWATPWRGASEDGGDLDHAIDFCEYVIEKGKAGVESHLSNLEAETSGPPVERVVRNQFQQSGCIPGTTTEEVAVGTTVAVTGEEARKSRNLRQNIATRDVDLVIEQPETDWIIEIKREYTAGKFDTALGQVIVSDSLYREDHNLSKADTQRAVVFGQLQSSMANRSKKRVLGHIVKTAHKHDVHIYVGVGENAFEEVTMSNYDSLPTGHWD